MAGPGNGASGGDRTPDLPFTKRLLYRLSYLGSTLENAIRNRPRPERMHATPISSDIVASGSGRTAALPLQPPLIVAPVGNRARVLVGPPLSRAGW